MLYRFAMGPAYVSLNGGLGNQLFQYLFALSLAQNQGLEVVVDDSRQERVVEHPDSRLTRTKFALPVLPIVSSIPPSERLRRGLHLIFRQFSSYRGESVGPNLLVFPDGTGIEINSGMLHQTTTTDCKRYVGYFQTHVFYSSLREEVKASLLDSCVATLAGTGIKAADIDFVVHVRRGDYRANPDYRILEESYYRKGKEHLNIEEGGILLSDEPESDDVHRISRELGLQIATGLSPSQSLAVIALAKAKIIANSSLSFAGALLGSNSAQTIAPLRWGQPGTTEKIFRSYPSNWHTV